jgi:xanthine dehydrogenase small subunit
LKQLAHSRGDAGARFGLSSPRKNLTDLLAARAAHPSAQLVAGCTDVGLWVTKQHRQFAQVLDVTRVRRTAPRRALPAPHRHRRGRDTDRRLCRAGGRSPAAASLCHRFAGLPVRNSGTLGGNVANGSPIGDSMPLLIALGANVVLMSQRGHRELPLEALYTGYRQNVMAKTRCWPGSRCLAPCKGELTAAYKISKRFDDDISAVCLAA